METVGIGQSKNEKKLILAFGDSLTRGYYASGSKYHPYTDNLNTLLADNNLHYKTIENGVNGETSDKMLDRIKKIDLSKYRLVIVYAGTNDLGSKKALDIAQNVMKIHEYILSYSICSIHVNLPPNECDTLMDFYSTKRTEVNKIALEYIKEYKDKIYLCDFASNLKYGELSEEDKKKYWDDHLHLTPTGYDFLSELIYDTISSNSILRKNEEN